MTLARLKTAWNVYKNGIPNIYGVRGHERQMGVVDQRDKKSMIEAYRSWVFACVSIRAKAISGTKFRVYVERGSEELEEVEPGHPLSRLLKEVNPVDTYREALYLTSAYQDLTGDAYWYIPKNGLGIPGEIWVLPSERMNIIPSSSDVIARYELKNQDSTIPFEPDEIVHFKHPNPQNRFYGSSVLMAAAHSADIDQFQHEYQRQFYQNFAIPPYALKTDSTLDEQTYERLQRDWNSRYRGSANSGKTGILEAGLSVEKIGVNPKELDWLNSNRATRDDILAIFGVPASKLGLVEDVNRANAEANDYTFSANVVEPILSLIDERMTQDLARKFDEKLIVQHDSTIANDEMKEAQIAGARLSASLTSINEEREALGYDPVEMGDSILVPANLVPLGAPQPEPAPDPVTEALKALPRTPDVNVKVEPAEVTVHTPKIDIKQPDVNVSLEMKEGTKASVKKRVLLEKDEEGRLVSARVEEE